MIIIKLLGGLGNQLFQYAVARGLALIHNTDLFLDISGYSSSILRKYELGVFNINASIASPDILKYVPFSISDACYLNIRHVFSGNIKIQYFKEKNFAFQKEILSLPDNIYLDGYWQSEKYFSFFEGILRKELSFASQPSIINQEHLERIKRCNSVSVHIRRGDYISNRKTMDIHGFLGTDYYARALNLVKEKITGPTIFVFSDDIDWAIENFKTDLPTHFIDHNRKENAYEDLRLMCTCKHHIIANSSFSWWGAWLCKNPDKVIIAPKRWFNTPKIDTRDLIPDSWIVL